MLETLYLSTTLSEVSCSPTNTCTSNEQNWKQTEANNDEIDTGDLDGGWYFDFVCAFVVSAVGRRENVAAGDQGAATPRNIFSRRHKANLCCNICNIHLNLQFFKGWQIPAKDTHLLPFQRHPLSLFFC